MFNTILSDVDNQYYSICFYFIVYCTVLYCSYAKI